MKFKRLKRTPLILAFSVLAFVGAVWGLHLDFPERLERMTYDLRVRAAMKFPSPAATNLAFVAMEDSSIAALRHGLLGRPYGLYWPRHVYGRLVEELAAQGAEVVAFDVLFGELRPDHAPVQMADGNLLESDEFFALQMRRAGNVISAFTPDVNPPDLFVTNALALGDISTKKDADGVLRQIKSFNLKWHPAFKSAARQMGVDLENARIETGRIVLPLPDDRETAVALDRDVPPGPGLRRPHPGRHRRPGAAHAGREGADPEGRQEPQDGVGHGAGSLPGVEAEGEREREEGQGQGGSCCGGGGEEEEQREQQARSRRGEEERGAEEDQEEGRQCRLRRLAVPRRGRSRDAREQGQPVHPHPRRVKRE